MTTFSFKIADTDEEFEAIHALNYRTFVEEISQHSPNQQCRLVDTFHDENTYAICKVDSTLVGMIAGRAKRPFSLDRKLDNLDSFLPQHQKPVEVRLLAIEPAYRKSSVFAQLVQVLATHLAAKGHDLYLISATLRQSRLYQHMGFTAFGPRVGTKEALYQPMYLDIRAYANLAQTLHRIQQRKAPLINLLPGPVTVKPEVEKAFSIAPISHRSAEFRAMHKEVTDQLKNITHSQQVFLLSGSGTNANDTIAAQLSTSANCGLVISNGEFGERLLEHACRWQLDYIEYRLAWGASLDIETIADLLTANSDVRWVWMVACETSTGINNPWKKIASYCQENGINLCLDAISAIGAAPLSLEQVRFASGVSGKALGAYPGIACVFYNGPPLLPSNCLPRVLDLALYQDTEGIPFTLSSNLLAALSTALTHTDWQVKYARVARLSSKLRQQLRAHDVTLLGQEEEAAAVITIVLPGNIDSVALCQVLRRGGYVLSGESSYLIERNWIQICLFGEFNDHMLINLPDLISKQIQKTSNARRLGKKEKQKIMSSNLTTYTGTNASE